MDLKHPCSWMALLAKAIQVLQAGHKGALHMHVMVCMRVNVR